MKKYVIRFVVLATLAAAAAFALYKAVMWAVTIIVVLALGVGGWYLRKTIKTLRREHD